MFFDVAAVWREKRPKTLVFAALIARICASFSPAIPELYEQLILPRATLANSPKWPDSPVSRQTG
jgi:hypothetical protein